MILFNYNYFRFYSEPRRLFPSLSDEITTPPTRPLSRATPVTKEEKFPFPGKIIELCVIRSETEVTVRQLRAPAFV